MSRLFTFFMRGKELMRETAVSHCEVASLFAAQLGLPRGVQDAVRHTWEQWDGKGMAYGLRGERTPVGRRACCTWRRRWWWPTASAASPQPKPS